MRSLKGFKALKRPKIMYLQIFGPFCEQTVRDIEPLKFKVLGIDLIEVNALGYVKI